MDLGCERCYGQDIESALAYCTNDLEVTRSIVSNSHFKVSLRRCPGCGQQFVAIFTEFVLSKGDAQYFDFVPVTPIEAKYIADARDDLLNDLSQLGYGRRRVAADYPVDEPMRIAWRSGTFHVEEGH